MTGESSRFHCRRRREISPEHNKRLLKLEQLRVGKAVRVKRGKKEKREQKKKKRERNEMLMIGLNLSVQYSGYLSSVCVNGYMAMEEKQRQKLQQQQ